jgi:hypothetical protein
MRKYCPVACFALTALCLNSCGTIANLASKDPQVFGGLQKDAELLTGVHPSPTPVVHGDGRAVLFFLALVAAEPCLTLVGDTVTLPLVLWLQHEPLDGEKEEMVAANARRRRAAEGAALRLRSETENPADDDVAPWPRCVHWEDLLPPHGAPVNVGKALRQSPAVPGLAETKHAPDLGNLDAAITTPARATGNPFGGENATCSFSPPASPSTPPTGSIREAATQAEDHGAHLGLPVLVKAQTGK